MNWARLRLKMQGCLLSLASVALAGILLVVNGAAVVAAYSEFVVEDTIFAQLKVAQFVYFVAPVVLLVIEWIAMDIVIDGIASMRRRSRD